MYNKLRVSCYINEEAICELFVLNHELNTRIILVMIKSNEAYDVINKFYNWYIELHVNTIFNRC